jgi:hypothetical protein
MASIVPKAIEERVTIVRRRLRHRLRQAIDGIPVAIS